MAIKPKAALVAAVTETRPEAAAKRAARKVRAAELAAVAATSAVEPEPTQMTQPPTQGVPHPMKTAEQFMSFGQGNLEAFMKSSQIFATGMQDLSKHMAATAQAAIEESLSTFKAMTTVKSLKEAMELQTAYARTAMEKAMAESGKLTEHSMKLVEQASAPITARVNAAVETFSTSVPSVSSFSTGV